MIALSVGLFIVFLVAVKVWVDLEKYKVETDEKIKNLMKEEEKNEGSK